MTARIPITRLLAQQRRCFSIGRMIDMGGAPSGSTDNSSIRPINTSKNSKLQAVAFDFEVLTKSIEETRDLKRGSNTTATPQKTTVIQPALDTIQQIASLLNVNVPETSTSPPSSTVVKTKINFPKAQVHEDVRAKYARKLQGGLAGVELAKSQVEETLARGDAAGHLVARKLAMKTTAASPSKWMAMTGTGVLLSYLSHRSIKIALLPNPQTSNVDQKDRQQNSMEALMRQLKDVVIDCVVRIDDSDKLQKSLEKELVDPIDVHPNAILVVSDRDDYLKAAKDLGMLTCRIQKPNTRRGNITAHFNTPSVPDVKEVINEINGISFNVVLNR
jgi:FMN phosphatase YigB (HAD superfamily)